MMTKLHRARPHASTGLRTPFPLTLGRRGMGTLQSLLQKKPRTDEFVDVTFEPVVPERHAAALNQLDVVKPGVRPSQRAAAAWMSSAFGAHWPSIFHPTHKLTLAVPFVFCRVCGHSSQARGRPGLRAICTGSPSADSNYGGRLRRFLAGQAPYGETAVLCPPVLLHR